MKRHLLTLYTRTPLHVGSGTSVDVVDLPIMRERITGFPVIPSTSLKGVLRQWARDAHRPDGTLLLSEEEGRTLFGEDRKLDEAAGITAHAGCVQIMEAKILAFPVRSLAGCFAWLTCPAALERFNRDTGRAVPVPQPQKDHVIAGAELLIPNQDRAVLEEYALATQKADQGKGVVDVAAKLESLTNDPLWTARDKLAARLAIVHDENFQHFVTTCTEVVARIAINPETRTAKGSSGEGGGALFNQENVPCEALFYSVLTVLPPRRDTAEREPANALAALLPDGRDPSKQPPILQIGGDETTGHGLCETKREELP